MGLHSFYLHLLRQFPYADQISVHRFSNQSCTRLAGSLEVGLSMVGHGVASTKSRAHVGIFRNGAPGVQVRQIPDRFLFLGSLCGCNRNFAVVFFRGGRIYDVFIDTIGVLLAFLFCRNPWQFLKNRRARRNNIDF